MQLDGLGVVLVERWVVSWPTHVTCIQFPQTSTNKKALASEFEKGKSQCITTCILLIYHCSMWWVLDSLQELSCRSYLCKHLKLGPSSPVPLLFESISTTVAFTAT